MQRLWRPTFLSSIEEGSVLGSVSNLNDFSTSQELHDKAWGDDGWDAQLHQGAWYYKDSCIILSGSMTLREAGGVCMWPSTVDLWLRPSDNDIKTGLITLRLVFPPVMHTQGSKHCNVCVYNKLCFLFHSQHIRFCLVLFFCLCLFVLPCIVIGRVLLNLWTVKSIKKYILGTSVGSHNHSHPVEGICWVWWHDAKERNLHFFN